MPPKLSPAYVQKQRELYQFSIKEKDQVLQWLQWDQSAKDWMKTFTLNIPHQTHHIAGRSTRVAQFHWFCNLAHASAAAHTYGHDVNSNQFELCCLRAKMAQECDRIRQGKPLPADESKWNWHPTVMARLYRKEHLRMRVDELLMRPGIEGTIFQKYGDELLRFLAL